MTLDLRKDLINQIKIRLNYRQGLFNLFLTSKQTNQVYTIEGLVDFGVGTILSLFSFELPEGIIEGEYTYEFKDEYGSSARKGIAYIVDYSDDQKKEYKFKKIKKVYERK